MEFEEMFKSWTLEQKVEWALGPNICNLSNQMRSIIVALNEERKVLIQELKDYKERFINEVEASVNLPMPFVSPARYGCDLCFKYSPEVKVYNVWKDHAHGRVNLCQECYESYKAEYFKQKERVLNNGRTEDTK